MWYQYLINILALAMWREARGETRYGMLAVGCVIRNNVKVKTDTKSWLDVLFHPFFISSLTAINDPEERKWPTVGDLLFEDAVDLATKLYDNTIDDNTNGATHYFNPHVVLPSWAGNMIKVASIGNHDFYK